MDRIYTIKLNKSSNTFEGSLLFEGDLNLDVYNPVETLPFYENDNISKVYFTDNKNQPRVINIKDPKVLSEDVDNNYFDFIQPLNYEEVITINKNNIGNGVFPSGTIQYSFTYFNDFLQETNIFYTSPLYFLSPLLRGGSAEEKVTCCFDISLNNLDTRFSNLRVYSIVRTSINAEPIIKKVTDLKIPETGILSFTDNNTTGEIITSTKLLYIGGEPIKAATIANKDNTLFLGNIELLRNPIGNLLVGGNTVKSLLNGGNIYFALNNDTSYKEGILYGTSHYPYNPVSLNKPSTQVKTFKWGETYRFGIQAQHKSGKWSEAIWINDALNNVKPSITPTPVLDTNPQEITIIGSKAYYALSNISLINKLIDEGYVNVRGVYVVPSQEDRTILAQGILNPVVSNYKDRADNSPFCQSSWALRPMIPVTPFPNYSGSHADNTFPLDLDNGTIHEFRHFYTLPAMNYRNAEIMGGYAEVNDALDDTIDIERYVHEFLVDQSIQTLYSPDIDFDPSFLTKDRLENLKLRIIGYSCLTGNSSYFDMVLTSLNPQGAPVNKNIKVDNYNINGYKSNISGLFYNSGLRHISGIYGIMLYPWHKQGSIANDYDDETTKLDLLTNKNMSNLRYCGFNKYLDTPWEAYVNGSATNRGISNVYTIDGDSDASVKIRSNNKDFLYKGSVNKIIYPPESTGVWGGKFHVVYSYAEITNPYYTTFKPFYGPVTISGDKENQPISMKYKTCNHVVFSFNRTSTNKMVIAPSINNLHRTTYGDADIKLFYEDSAYKIHQDNITISGNNFGGVWLAELYRDDVSSTRYGGQTDEAFENNLWIPCGEVVKLQQNTPVIINYTEGDTYIQRYDCLRTSPYSVNDYQTNTEIVSFLCESRINLDARYDRNRGNVDNRASTRENFNLYNPVYTQPNNYFSYRALNYDRFSINTFPTTITWTGIKLPAELIDSWTNVNMSGTLELDGNYGSVNKILNFNDTLLGFQDNAIFNILHNSRVQINPSDGVPIELSSSNKVDGKRYITTNIGCSNKWGVLDTPYGIYFVDTNRKSIYVYSDTLHNLGVEAGFSSWFNLNLTDSEKWSPYSFNNFVVHNDSRNNMVYFTNRNYTLGYSETDKMFVSFYNYEDTPFIFDFEGNGISLRKDLLNSETKLWKTNTLDYPSFFGRDCKSYITYLVNPEVQTDKTFWGVSFRADSKKGNSILRAPNISSIKAWNEYQWGYLKATYNPILTSSIKEQNRIWNSPFPNVQYDYPIINNNNPINPYKPLGLDRFRNTWTYLKLTTNNYDNTDSYTVLHDLVVKFNN